jgi:hypothetical protein
MRRWRVAGCLASASLLLVVRDAAAYRPFNGTDADVAKAWTLEVELGPLQYLRQGRKNVLEAPDLVLNLGLIERLELVIDGQNDVAVGPLQPGTPRVSLVGDDLLLKYVFRDGTLQEKNGVSLGAEGGVLTPELHGTPAFGASLDVIASYRWSSGTVHWNEWLEYTREHHADLFNGVIVEGPHEWTVRPVMEAFYDKDFAADHSFSVLVGAIWTLPPSLSFDLGLRGARAADETIGEVRVGLTWSLPFGPLRSTPVVGRRVDGEAVSVATARRWLP